MDTKELLKKVRKIEIKTKGLSNHIFTGEYHSAFKGRGMTFSEVREYQYGDDVRSIDWNVTARFNHPYVKIYEEERELTMLLLVDVSRSSWFGTVQAYKREVLAEISAVLAFSAMNNNDKVGAIFFSSEVEKFIPPKKGRSHILRIIRELLDYQAEGHDTNIGEAVKYMNQVVKKRCIAFVLSDFIALGYAEPLRIAGRKHDVVGVRVYDERDAHLPDVGLVHLLDAEQGTQRWIDTSKRKTREAYEQHFRQTDQYFKTSFQRSGQDSVSLRTQDSYVRALMQLFKKREGHQ